MERLTRWVLRHRLLVIVFWAVVTGAGFVASANLSNSLSQEFSVPGYAAFEANKEIVQDYGSGGTYPPAVLVTTVPEGAQVTDAAALADWRRTLLRVERSAPGLRVVGYPGTRDAKFISEDGRTTFAYVYGAVAPGFDQTPIAAPQIDAAAKASSVAGAPVGVTGLAYLVGDTGGGSGPSLLVEVLLGGVGALAVLVFVFASFLALAPLMVAVVAIPTTFLLLLGLTQITDVAFIVQFLVGLIGLGVAIDYALLIVTRWREEKALGATGDDAVARAMGTAGKAVVASGITVAIGLLALVVLPVPFLRSIGFAGLLIPVVSVAVSITLLPVVLAKAGDRLAWPNKRREDTASGPWTRWAEWVVRRRWVAAAIGLAILVVLLIPASQINIGSPSADSLSSGGPARDGLTALQQSGLGSGPLTPMEVITTPAQAQATADALRSVQGVRAAVVPPGPDWMANGTALVEVIPLEDAGTAGGRETIERVRDTAADLPWAPAVGGYGPKNEDFIDAVYGSFPLMIALISVITFIFLAREFRSLLLPLKAIVLNIVSVLAAWGVMVWAWQEGNLSEPIWGTAATGALSPWVPLMVFAFLYGLSMDYEVFILSRMREEFDATGSNSRAIVTGIGRTGRLVTSAALILFLAFVALGATPETDVRVFATGLAAGIILDATVVRSLLVPSLVAIAGRWNWWLPPWAARILRVPPSDGRGPSGGMPPASDAAETSAPGPSRADG